MNGQVKRKRLPFPYGLRHITPLLRFLRPQRSERSIFTLLPCVHGESLGSIIKRLPWDVHKFLHGYMLGCLRMEPMKVCNGVLAIAQVGHWFPRIIPRPISFPPDKVADATFNPLVYLESRIESTSYSNSPLTTTGGGSGWVP